MSEFAARYDEMMAQPWVGALYEQSAFFNTGYWRDGVTSQREACELLIDEIIAPLGDRTTILDVGCGFGATTRALRARFPGAAIDAINISAHQIDVCRRTVEDARFHVMDATSLRFDDASFDAVISVEAAFHFDTREAFFAEAARVLRPGGMLVLSDMLYRDVTVAGAWMIPPANRITALEAYSDALERAGFDDIVVRDETVACWNAYCDNLRRWKIAPPDFLDRVEASVARYVIASATLRSA
jgi:cyclopropane fatty-acyl-phospholipid synthase-like methyltransferase